MSDFVKAMRMPLSQQNHLRVSKELVMGDSVVALTIYSTILFMDSMVALEAKPLTELPWHEIDAIGPILVLVVPQVMTEIDKRKRDGRLGRRAREFNRLIGPAAEAASTARICKGPPIVDIGIAACDRIDWDSLDDLDPEMPDARVVAQMLCARGVSPDHKLLLSHDINPIAMASRHGLKTRKMPDHWLLEPEPSPSEKEMSKLKARLRQLESTAPEVQASVTFEVGAPLQLYQVHPLSDKRQSELVDRILVENPKPEHRVHFNLALGYNSSLDERYEKYRNSMVPRHAATLHRRLETHYGQVPFLLRIENVGHVQAENLVLALTAIGGNIHNRFVCYPLFGPMAPQPKVYDPLESVRRFEIPRPVGRHEMEFAVAPHRGEAIELHCADFRQGREWQFQGIALIDPHQGSPFKLHVSVTASNLRGAVSRSFELEYSSESVAADDLISLQSREFHVEFPMQEQFCQQLGAKNLKWFDFTNEEDEESD